MAVEAVFDEQPAEVQAAIQTGADAFAAAYREGLEKRVAGAFAKMEEGGAKISEFPAEERAAWAAKIPNVAMEWAKANDAKGLAGTDTLKAYMRRLKEGGADLPRDWSAE